MGSGFNTLERNLLNDFQRNFPLVERPYDAIGKRLGISEARVLSMLNDFRGAGFISRVGPVFRPRRLGASTLAAMEVPPERLRSVADVVSAFPQVNHNYQRDHYINLWFVVTARDAAEVRDTLHRIEHDTGLSVLDLPLETAYHIDLGFDLFGAAVRRRTPHAPETMIGAESSLAQGIVDERLLAEIQDGLALTPRPFHELAQRLGMEHGEVIARLEASLASGHIKRIGIVVHHRALGFTANAMVVWDIKDVEVDDVGRRLASYTAVTLCYRRPRRLPKWPYNLFCMIHGRDREQVLTTLDSIVAEEALESIPRAGLFSVRGFKQRGARYVSVNGHAG